jgi:hypothetical protein
MQHRREIRKLSDARAKALDEAKTTGAERDKQMREMGAKQAGELKEFVQKTWQQANEMAATHKEFGQYVSPREGDDEWNSRLEKGFALTDQTIGFHPFDPKLSPKDREMLIKRQAAVRHRSAAFGALTYDNQKLKGEVTRLQAELDKFKGSTPPAAGGSSTPAPAGALKGFAAIRAEMEKIAK